MDNSRLRPSALPISARHSLRVRLPLLISLMLAAVVAAILWVAYREVEASLVRAGGDRAKGVADQVANLLGASSNAGMEQLRRAAADADVVGYLRNPTDESRAAARARIAALAKGGPRRIELWNTAGARVLEISIPAAAAGTTPAFEVPTATHPPTAGFNPFQVVDGVLVTDSAAEVRGSPLPPTLPEKSAVLGLLVVRSALSNNAPGVLGKLVGDDAVVALGNSSGGAWTDLSRVVPAPAVDVARNGVQEYRTAKGERRLGAVAQIAGTPWAVWVEFPRSGIIAPARVFLRRMIWLALIVVVVGAALVGTLSVRITRPLRELAQAADGIAVGDYSRTITAPRRDEIGRLSRAFNAMVADVKGAQQQLEARVQERTHALDALRSSEAHYRTIVDVALDCIITIDAQGRVVEFNPAAEKTFGYRKREVVGREIADLIALPGPGGDRPGFARYITEGESPWAGQRVETTALRSNGTEFPVELAISAVPSDGGPILTGVARDLTERKRMEDSRLKSQALEEQHSRMLEANRLKSEFLANMSHELRTPLNAIIGFAELMHRGKVGPVSADHEEYLGDILTSSRHLLQLINDVLDLAKVEAGKMEFWPEPVDVTTLVNEVCDILRVLAASQALQLVVEIDPDVNAVVVDPARVKQILYNYLSNAIKFTPAGGRVVIRVGPEGPDMFHIDVEDTGVGIPAEDLGKLFVAFQQLDGGTAKQHQGTGLGLALIKRLVEAQGGRVAVRSVPGEGSTFSATLPRRMTMAVDGSSAPIQPSADNRTVLVLDDDPVTLKLADVALRESGHRPVCKDNAIEALLAAEADPPAAVIVDLILPGLNGFEFISRLRAFPACRDTCIIVWTVKDLKPSERRQLQASGAVIVPKSSGGPEALLEELRRLLPVAAGASGPAHGA